MKPVIINKKKEENLLCRKFFRVSKPQCENQRNRNEKRVLRLCERSEKDVEHESDSDTDCDWRTWNSSERVGTRTGRVGNRSSNRDYPDYGILKISKNTDESPRGLRRLAFPQNPVK